MKKKSPTAPVSMGDIAQAAGVSRATVSYVLRNRPGVSAPTRRRILSLARKLGFQPDAGMTAWMEQVRHSRHRELLPLAWINTGYSPNMWRERAYFEPYLRGAADRCAQLGYRLDEFWLREPGMNGQRLSQILHNRGIRGLLITPPDRGSYLRLHLKWEWFAAVSFEKALVAPALSQVAQDRYYNLLLCLKHLRRLGFRRMALILNRQSDHRACHSMQAAATYFLSQIPPRERLPLLKSGRHGIPDQFKEWLHRHRPDVVIAQQGDLIQVLNRLGYEVPRDLSVAHLAVDGDCDDWAGIFARKYEIGAAAAETVISLVQQNTMGLPAVPRDILIRGAWQRGITLSSPGRRT